MRILLVDGDEIFIDKLQKNLSQQNYTIDAVTDGQQGWVYIDTYTYDLVILDWELEKINVIELCGKIRFHGYDMPILLLTKVNHSSAEKNQALDVGVDDCLCQPFSFEELNARIRALLRRFHCHPTSILNWGNLQLDPCSCQVTYQQKPISLTNKEYQLLELFLRCPYQVFSIEDILDNLWTSVEYPSSATVRSHLRHLRGKLKEIGLKEDPIETLRGRGYRLKSAPENQGEAENLFIDSKLDYQITSEDNCFVYPCDELRVESPLILLIDDDEQFSLFFSQQAIEQELRVITIDNLESAQTWLSDLANHKLPHLVMIKITFHSNDNQQFISQSLALIAHLQAQTPSIPTIVIADRDQLSDRLLVAEKGATFYLKKPITPEEAIKFCHLALKRSSIGKKIMIVDDDEELLRELPNLLQPWHFNITTLHDTRQFWDVLEAVEPDLLILDLEMPHYSGLDLCRIIKTHPHWYHLPILLSAEEKNEFMEEKALVSGASGLILKPISPHKLTDRILHCLQ